MTRIAATISGLLAAVSMPAMAVAQDTADESETTQRSGIAEIIVTAERRSDTIQDVPLSISAITSESLAKSSIYDTEALASTVPGLVLQRDVVGKAVIRGIGTENFTVGGDPGVATYVDGAYMARSSTAIFDFFDVERIEVLRGPQGTLYGRNATGGVINVISKAPTDYFEARGSFTYGNYDMMRGEAAVSGPISEGIRARIAGLYSKRDGFTENIFPGLEGRGLDELDSKDLWAVRGRLDFDLGDRVKLELIGDIYRDDSNPPAFWYTDDTLPWQDLDPSNPSVYPRDLRTVSQGYETAVPGLPGVEVGQANRQDQHGITGRLTYEGDSFTITSVTSWRDIEFDWLNDGDGLSDFLVVYFQKDQSEQFSQDIQIASNGDGPFQWIVGGFYLTEDSDGLYAIPLGPLFGNSTIAYIGTNKTDALGIFAEGAYEFGDFTVTAGLRYSDESKDATLNYLFPLIGLDLDYDESLSFDALTPRFVIEYEPTPQINLYASVTRGFKSGGFSLLDNPLNAFDAEKIWAYEIGLKSQTLNNRLRFNTAAFYYDYTDQQLSQVTNLATQTRNAGSSTIWGVEAEFTAVPINGFTLEGNVSYLNTEFDEFCTTDTRNPTLPVDPVNCTVDGVAISNLAGNRLPRAPDWQAFIAATYEMPLTNSLDGFIRGEWQYTGDQFFSVFNRPTIAQDAYSVFNASIGVGAADDSWEVKAWVRNLGDKEYFSNLFESGVFDFVVVPQGFVAPPRTYGVTVGFNF